MNRRNISAALPGKPYTPPASMGPAPPLPPGPPPAQQAYPQQADQGQAHAAAWAAYYQAQGIAAPLTYAASPQAAQPAAPAQASGSNPYANYGYGAGARHGNGQAAFQGQATGSIGPSQPYRPPVSAPAQPYAAPTQPAAAYAQQYPQAAGAYQGQQAYPAQQYPAQPVYAGQQQQPYAGWPAQQQQGYTAPAQGQAYQAPAPQQPFYPQAQQSQQYTPQPQANSSPYRPQTPTPMHNQNRPYQPQPGHRLPSGPGRPPMTAPTGPQGGFPPAKRPRFDGPGGMNGMAGMAQPNRPPVRPAVRPGPNMGQPGFNAGMARPPAANRASVPPVVRPPIRLGMGGPPPNLGPRGAVPMRGRGGGPVNAPRGPANMRRNDRGGSVAKKVDSKSDRDKEKKHRDKEKELKTTMTDFRIVGIEMKELGWKWGLVDGQDDKADVVEEKEDVHEDEEKEQPKEEESGPKVEPEDAKKEADQVNGENSEEATAETSELKVEAKAEDAPDTNGGTEPAVDVHAQTVEQDATDVGVEEKRGEKRKAKTPDGDDDEHSNKRPDYHLTHNKPTQGNHESNSNRFRIYFESPPELDRIPKAARRNPNKRWKRESSSVAPSRAEDVENGDVPVAPEESRDEDEVAGNTEAKDGVLTAEITGETPVPNDLDPAETITAIEAQADDAIALPLETPIDVTVKTTNTEVLLDAAIAAVEARPPVSAPATTEDDPKGEDAALPNPEETTTSVLEALPPPEATSVGEEVVEVGDISMVTDPGIVADVVASTEEAVAADTVPEAVEEPLTQVEPAQDAQDAPAENSGEPTAPVETAPSSEATPVPDASAAEVESTLAKSAENAASAYKSRTRRRSSVSSIDSRDEDPEATLDGPSFNRLSILYEDSKRRLCFDAAVVERVKIHRADGKIEVILLPLKIGEITEEKPKAEGEADEGKPDVEVKTSLPKGVLVETYDDTDQRFVSVHPEKLEELWKETTNSAESVPPVHKAFSSAATSGLTIVVHLNKKRPLSEPKWCRTNQADEWLLEQFGSRVASSSSGWSGKLEIVDPDPVCVS
ncbi:hypothetical protein BCR39DRAFT_554155 [Naematelia encephala]|uniref:Uncharacterized protein n=1 Tax=Naematelia encephala TaxID=71784 RepID=A0A1Y2AF85_9TREE|nr:hypothetical protein BCR39DRAFT_554155 [Naematelia encephala]